MTIQLFEMTLYIIGLITALIIFLPFSPMTIDLVNLSRDTQIKIYKHRRVLWTITSVCFALLLFFGVRGLFTSVGDFGNTAWLSESLTSPDTLWFRSALITIPILTMLFWGGYVPFVMSPPNRHKLLTITDADKIIRPDDTVLGLVHGNEARAYLRDEIARPHYFQDNVGKDSLTVSYCILCNSSFAFKSELEGKALNLKCVTAYNNNIIYYDSATENFIQQLEAKVIDGPDKGKPLDILPVTLATWSDWKSLHPDTKFYSSPPTTLRDKMVGLMLQMMIPISRLSKRTKPWHRIQSALDKRLPAMSLVLGVEINGESCGYPVIELSKDAVRIDTIGGQPIVVFYDKRLDIGGVFSSQIDSRTLTFIAATKPGTPVVAQDKETGTFWDVSGKAYEGHFLGQSLQPIPHFNKLFWFSWALFKPATRVGHK